MISNLLVCQGHFIHGNAPIVADFGGGSVFGQSCNKITGRHQLLCCNPLRWMVWVALGTLPLSIGRVDGATGQT